jgi:NAD-reducing hydrogenase small subunit
MSFLDLDEWLADLGRLVDIVYCPLIDVKEYPQSVDVALVEGAVANEDNREMALRIRERTRVVIAFGDCAVTGNVTAMRNPLGSAKPVLERGYLELPTHGPAIPVVPGILPLLEDRVRPLQEVIAVDGYLPGCPPSAGVIREFLEGMVAGGPPVTRQPRFG